MARGSRIEYADFAVRIAPDGAGGHESKVLLAAAGVGNRAVFRSPFVGVEIPTLLNDLARRIPAGCGNAPRHLETPPDAASRRHDPKEVGTRLFSALFRDDVKTALALNRPRRGDPGLRIRLLIDPRGAGCAEIAALPWELLYDPLEGEYLSKSPQFSIVRFLEGPRAHSPQSLTGQLRVLAAICSPRELGPLDGGAERAAVLCWSEIPGVSVDVIEEATFDGVCARLAEDFHVFHFSGHGRLARGEGTLAFERADRGADLIKAELLAAHLLKAPSLQLAVLNACDSGKLPRSAGADPFAGVTSALIRSAVPAVVGMQFPISDRAAACFARTLYTSLAAGNLIDAAVTEGRLALLRDQESLEWATPTLHLRVTDGRLFDRTEPPPAAVEPTRIEPPPLLPLAELEPSPKAHRLGPLATTAALVLLAALAWGAWRAIRPGEPGVESQADGRSDTDSASGGAGLSDARIAAAECPHERLPGFRWALISGDLELPPDEPGGAPRMLVVDEAICIGAYETTWGDLRSVLREEELPEEDPQHADKLPAYGVTWELAQKFLDRLNEGDPDRPFRLPTAEEWEFSARAASTADYSFGDDPLLLPDHGNCQSRGPKNDGFDNDPAPVGSFQPNGFGLYDMHGNVWEWVSDPPGQDHEPDYRLRCGGSYANAPATCTASCTSAVQGDRSNSDTGFRIVRELAPGRLDARP